MGPRRARRGRRGVGRQLKAPGRPGSHSGSQWIRRLLEADALEPQPGRGDLRRGGQGHLGRPQPGQSFLAGASQHPGDELHPPVDLCRSEIEAEEDLGGARRGVPVDLAAARVTRGGREVPVTRTEYLLLELFLRNPGRVLSHSQIFQAVWGYDFGLRSHNLWVYMSYLRAKLEAAGEPRILHTVRGLGYVLRDAP